MLDWDGECTLTMDSKVLAGSLSRQYASVYRDQRVTVTQDFIDILQNRLRGDLYCIHWLNERVNSLMVSRKLK